MLLAVLLLVTSVAQAVTFEASSKKLGLKNSSSLTITLPSGTVDGDVLVATIAGHKNIGTIAPPAGWSILNQGNNGGEAELGVFYKVASTETGPYIFTFSSNKDGETAGAILRYSGVDTGSPQAVIAATAATGNSTTPTAPTNTTPGADYQVLRVFAQAGDKNKLSSLSEPPTGHTERVDFGFPKKVLQGVSDITQLSAGSTGTGAFTVTVARPWRAVTFALKNVPPADIEVTSKIVAVTGGSVLPIDENDTIQYLVTVKNNGPSDAPGLKVMDVLPSGLTFNSATPTQGSYDSATGVWDIGTLSNLATVTLTIDATVDTGVSGHTITNTAEALYDNDSDNSNNSKSVTFTVPGSDLAVTKTASPQNPEPGDQVTFSVTLTNNGPDTVTESMVVNDPLRGAFVFVSANGSYNANTGDWSIPGPLANGASVTLDIVVTITTEVFVAGVVKNTACITSTHADDINSNDCDSATVQVVNTNFSAGACIIDMSADADGDKVQTVNEGMKPYGLMFRLLRDHNIPIHWVINPDKADESGVDVEINGINYLHGPMVIDSEYVNLVIDLPNVGDTVRDFMEAWAVANADTNANDPPNRTGFTYRCDLPPFTATVFDTLTVWPLGVLDADNGLIAADYYVNAGFPLLTNPDTPPYAAIGRPRDLSSCHDIYIMPHADPQTNWLDNEEGDLIDGTTTTVFDTIKLLKFMERGGQFWAACHAVSAMERLVDIPPQGDWDAAGETPLPEATPGQSPSGMFLLTDDTSPKAGGLVEWDLHNDAGAGPFSIDNSTVTNPVMQYMGGVNLVAATLGGSEQIYLPDDRDPNVSGWRDSTAVAIYDTTQVELKSNGGTLSDGEAAIVAYGRAFGNDNYGYVLYEAGHDHDKGNGGGIGDVAAQRMLMNLHFLTGILRRPEISGVVTVTEIERTELNGIGALVTVVGVEGSGTFSYEWYDTNCGGSFDNPTGDSTIWTPAAGQLDNLNSLSCVLGVTVSDDCSRANFLSFPLKVLAYDIGDAPAGYELQDAARHEVWPDAPYLGMLADQGVPDVENSTPGFAGITADGDDNDTLDDEDGVTWSFTHYTRKITATVTASNPNPYEDAMLCGYLDGGNTNPFVKDGAFNRDGSSTDEEICVTVPKGTVETTYDLTWDWKASSLETTYGRFRITTDPKFFSANSPSPTGTVRDGEVEDHPIDINPTAVTIGSVDLQVADVTKFLADIGVDQIDTAGLLALLTAWDSDLAAALVNTDRNTILKALRSYLDPDADGQVAILSWDTLEERGTIGFYALRKQTGGHWITINNTLLPGLITAPMGGDYMLADPSAQAGRHYLYKLVEQEARGGLRAYGPFELKMDP